MLKRIALSVLLLGLISACGLAPFEPLYTPNTVKFDVRTAQEQTRDILMKEGLGSYNVNDVRFRNDGMAFLLNSEGTQSNMACYYSALAPRVTHQHPNYLGGPADVYVVYLCPGQTVGIYDNEAEARRLADALFALKNSSR